MIMQSGYRLAQEIGVPNVDGIFQLVERNALVFTKVIMSFHRRLDEASKFFAQGRVNFADAPDDQAYPNPEAEPE